MGCHEEPWGTKKTPAPPQREGTAGQDIPPKNAYPDFISIGRTHSMRGQDHAIRFRCIEAAVTAKSRSSMVEGSGMVGICGEADGSPATRP